MDHNQRPMRRFFILAILSTLGAASGAEVIRCADAAGNVSYTDNACPAGARPVGRVSIPEAASVSPQEAQSEQNASRAGQSPRRSPDAIASPSQAPAGPAIIDSRGGGNNDPAADSRWSDRGDDPAAADYGGYPYYPAASNRSRPPRDMRPRIRSCDASGCKDTLGNQYNRSGQLDRYRSIDGRTCQPVGTTTICR
jgi:hypothetical protein